jgi:hypothetical protein
MSQAVKRIATASFHHPQLRPDLRISGTMFGQFATGGKVRFQRCSFDAIRMAYGG